VLYYGFTADVANMIVIMFKAAFPKVYAQYHQAFNAGVWLQEDPGLFLGCLVVYKLQSKLHNNGNDVGLSASFAVGFFEGSEMLVPQLKTKLL